MLVQREGTYSNLTDWFRPHAAGASLDLHQRPASTARPLVHTEEVRSIDDEHHTAVAVVFRVCSVRSGRQRKMTISDQQLVASSNP